MSLHPFICSNRHTEQIFLFSPLYISLIGMLGWVAESTLLGCPVPKFGPKNSTDKPSRANTGKKDRALHKERKWLSLPWKNTAPGALNARRCDCLTTWGRMTPRSKIRIAHFQIPSIKCVVFACHLYTPSRIS